MNDHTQQELQRLENRLAELQDILRAAQRLFDEIHLASTSHVKLTGSVTLDNVRLPSSDTFTIQSTNGQLAAAIDNLGQALKHLYTS